MLFIHFFALNQSKAHGDCTVRHARWLGNNQVLEKTGNWTCNSLFFLRNRKTLQKRNTHVRECHCGYCHRSRISACFKLIFPTCGLSHHTEMIRVHLHILLLATEVKLCKENYPNTFPFHTYAGLRHRRWPLNAVRHRVNYENAAFHLCRSRTSVMQPLPKTSNRLPRYRS